jgi:hypothetical protein
MYFFFFLNGKPRFRGVIGNPIGWLATPVILGFSIFNFFCFVVFKFLFLVFFFFFEKRKGGVFGNFSSTPIRIHVLLPN